MNWDLNRADYLTENGANVLADVLRAHWRQLGHEVYFHVVVKTPSYGSNTNSTIHCVRSNLVNGLPPDARRVTNGGDA